MASSQSVARGSVVQPSGGSGGSGGLCTQTLSATTRCGIVQHDVNDNDDARSDV